jgi:hypothetical protein
VKIFGTLFSKLAIGGQLFVLSLQLLPLLLGSLASPVASSSACGGVIIILVLLFVLFPEAVWL